LTAISPGNLWAVGSATSLSSTSATLTEHYNGSAWSLVSSAQPTQVGDLEAVAALTPANVWAIGQPATGNQTQPVVPLVEHFNGTSWKVQPAPSLGGNSVLSFDGLVTTGSGRLWSVGSRNPAGTTVWQTLTARYS